MLVLSTEFFMAWLLLYFTLVLIMFLFELGLYVSLKILLPRRSNDWLTSVFTFNKKCMPFGIYKMFFPLN